MGQSTAVLLNSPDGWLCKGARGHSIYCEILFLLSLLNCLDIVMFSRLHVEWTQAKNNQVLSYFSVKPVPYFSSAEGFEQLTDCAETEISWEEPY